MCFKTMNDYLRKNICGIRDMWKLNAEVEDLEDRIAACIPAHLQYACRHWATHLSKTLLGANSAEDDVCNGLMLFSSMHLLYWLEVLSLTGWLAEALPALRHAQDWASVSHIYIECTRRAMLTVTYPHRSHTRLQTSSVICFMMGSGLRLSSFCRSASAPCIFITLLYHSLLKAGSCVRYITASWAV
jgi:hypothetical protein